MPSQICHILLAREAAAENGRTEWVDGGSPFFLFGAQGPDFFYHNGRTRPSGRTFGALLHRRSYGRFLVRLTACLRELPPAERSDLRHFAAGFLTHAPLDRLAHPYIDYRAGWEERGRPETKKYRRGHAFLERILDVAFLRDRYGLDPEALDAPGLMDCGPRLPEPVIKAVARGLRELLPDWNMVEAAEQRISNAYGDARGFYYFTGDPDHRRDAVAADSVGPDRRRLALFHPVVLPTGYDFLNTEHSAWRHPVDGRVSHESFGDLFDRAVGKAAEGLELMRVAEETGDLDALERTIGNRSLSTAPSPTTPRIHSAPIPLAEILNRQYEALSGAGGTGPSA